MKKFLVLDWIKCLFTPVATELREETRIINGGYVTEVKSSSTFASRKIPKLSFKRIDEFISHLKSLTFDEICNTFLDRSNILFWNSDVWGIAIDKYTNKNYDTLTNMYLKVIGGSSVKENLAYLTLVMDCFNNKVYFLDAIENTPNFFNKPENKHILKLHDFNLESILAYNKWKTKTDEIKKVSTKELVLSLEIGVDELRNRIDKNSLLVEHTPDNIIKIIKDFRRLLILVLENNKRLVR